MFATQPEISPDGTKLVNVEEDGGNGYPETDYEPYEGRLVVHTLDLATNTVGPSVVLLDRDTLGDNISSYYPSFSPDGQWLIMTRVNGGSYDDGGSQTWVMKSDGSAPPVKLEIADDTLPGGTNPENSWARWRCRSRRRSARRTSRMFYLTWSSRRPFGNRIPYGGTPQIWMAPFFPARAAQGMDPSGKVLFRVPFQNVRTANHIAQWTQAVVRSRCSDRRGGRRTSGRRTAASTRQLSS